MTLRQVSRQALFVGSGGDQRFTLITEPRSAPVRGTVLHLPPFAEEMNKSRRQVALGAFAFASAGWRVVQVDLLGCGDSAGDLAVASWDIWVEDLAYALQCHRIGTPLWLWGVRAGALFVDALLRRNPKAGVLLWQPVTSGKQHLSQFLRLRAAAAIVGQSGASARKAVDDELAAGRAVEVAGYMIGSQLVQGLQSATLALDAARPARLRWIEVSADADPQIALASRRLLDHAKRNGVDTEAVAVAGQPFWTTQELVEVDGLPALTAAMADERSPRVIAA